MFIDNESHNSFQPIHGRQKICRYLTELRDHVNARTCACREMSSSNSD